MITLIPSDDMPDEHSEPEFEKLFSLDQPHGIANLFTDPTIDAERYAQLEHGAVEEALDNQIAYAQRMLCGLENFFTRKHLEDLESRATNAEEVAVIGERNTALHRAKQIIGVVLSELILTARTLTMQQLLRENDTPGAHQIAEWLDTLNPTDYADE